jgi:ABC-type branched-subunit amino acid transport system substrate-binding protein
MYRSGFRTRATSVWAVLLVCVLLITGCSSSKSAGTSGTGTSGDPIKVMMISDASGPYGNFANEFKIAKAEAKAINDAGGINGHPLNLETCDGQSNPNQGGVCARKAAAGGYVALVGGTSSNSQVIDDIVQPAGLPWVAQQSIKAADSANTLNFPISAGLPAQFSGAGKLASNSGCQRMVIVTSNSPTAATLVGIMQRGIALGTGAKKVVGIVDLQEGSTDFSSIATKVNSYNPDCAMPITTDANTVQFLSAAQTIGSKFRVVTISGVISATHWKQLGGKDGLLENALLASPFGATSLPAWAPYFELIKNNGGTDNLTAYSSYSQGAWLVVNALAAVLKQIQGRVTRETLVAQLKKTADLNSIMGAPGTLLPKINFTEPWTANPAGPSEYTRSVISQKVVGGDYVDGGFGTIDMSEAILPSK